jgi:hypothetical protein
MVTKKQALEVAYEALSWILESPELTKEFIEEQLSGELGYILEEEGEEVLSVLRAAAEECEGYD